MTDSMGHMGPQVAARVDSFPKNSRGFAVWIFRCANETKRTGNINTNVPPIGSMYGIYYIYIYLHLVDFLYGQLVGKYTVRPMDANFGPKESSS